MKHKVLGDNVPYGMCGTFHMVVQTYDNNQYTMIGVEDGQTIRKRFSPGKMLEHFLESCGVEEKEQAVGKHVWVCVAIDEVAKTSFIFKFFPYIKGYSKPMVKGDPENNDGEPFGPFVRKENKLDIWS